MATITTGNTDTLKTFWLYNDAPNGVFWNEEILIRELLSASSVSSTSTQNQKIVALSNGGTETFKGSMPSSDKSSWTINELDYQNPNNDTLIVKGAIKFNQDGSVSTSSSIQSIDVLDPAQNLLVSNARPISAGLSGSFTIYYQNEILEFTANATKKYAVMANGDQMIILGTNTYDTLSGHSDQHVNKVQILNGQNTVLLEISALNFTGSAEEEVALASADTFEAYFLRGNDSITGTSGNDYLYAGAGNDTVMARNGNDLIIGGDGAGNDNYNGGNGVDSIKYTSARAGIAVNLNTGVAKSIEGNDAAGIGTDRLSNIESVFSGNFNDSLIGSNVSNQLTGNDGNDTIDGGLGSDTLIGGSGRDTFVFDTKLGSSNIDTITDFQSGVDKIALAKAVFTAFKATAAVADTFYSAAGATTGHVLSDRIIYDPASGKLYYDADGSGKGAAVQIALVGTTTHAQLLDTDFVVV